MTKKYNKIIVKLSELGFDKHLKKRVKLYFEGSLEKEEYVKIQNLIIFIEEILDESLFKKRTSQ